LTVAMGDLDGGVSLSVGVGDAAIA
jgi:hypothetical protein